VIEGEGELERSPAAPATPWRRRNKRSSRKLCHIVIEATMKQPPSAKMRELRTAMLIALGLAFVCFGGAVLASSFVTH
jgi:hypothetical protein